MPTQPSPRQVQSHKQGDYRYEHESKHDRLNRLVDVWHAFDAERVVDGTKTDINRPGRERYQDRSH